MVFGVALVRHCLLMLPRTRSDFVLPEGVDVGGD
jgi:hypothetical protein